YLRLLTNPADEEALKRVINYPGRGIGFTTIEKLVVTANHYKRSIFEVMQNLHKLPDLKINAGTRKKLEAFVLMIQSFQVINQTATAFEIAEHVAKKTGLFQELKKDATPEGVAKIENIEELLNGIKDFVEEQKEIDGTTGALSEFLEDVALATDMDNDTGDDDRVALMTIHLSKGLEFPYLYIVGLEEDLFPSGMSMNTRSELEEERRLFYVALTRAEKQAYLTYAQSRYRWGKLVDCEPSRFIEEIDEKYLEFMTPMHERRYKPMMDIDVFGEVDKSRLRLKKPISGAPSSFSSEAASRKLRKIKPNTDGAAASSSAGTDLIVGNIVEHIRFGKGEVVRIEGGGTDKKAEIRFANGGLKKLLLRFAKLNVIR
ncbi:MAG: ATP-binding domain-containing protein, partial [Flavobacteriaceae bacterium]|nr:ATP-binding domain-containing protein [Flavobacteriaceae bacterium]